MSPLYALFFLSGATSLVWETLWSRQLHLVFGTSQFAITTVLCAFMAGLAGGAVIASRWPSRNPFRTYAILEGLIGIFGLLFPFLLSLAEPLYLHLASGLDPVLFGVVQFFMVGSLLLLPTACMGATLPVLTPLVQRQQAGGAIGRLYAINTVGAVVGVALGGFYLLPDWWVSGTTWVTAAANGLLAVLAGFYSRRDPGQWVEEWAETAEESAPPEQLGSRATLGWAAAFAGFSSLALEVAWFRLLSLVLGASVYAFSLMLLAFLIGIASGGEIGGIIADNLGAQVRKGAAAAQAGVAALSWGAMWLYGWLPLTFVWLFFAVRKDPELVWPAKCVVALLVMTPPAVLMGASFPLLVRSAGRNASSEDVGFLYAANTAGGVLGAFLAGFVLLPRIEVTGTVLLAVSVNLLGAAVLLGGGGWRKAAVFPLVAAAAVWIAPPPWNPMLMTSGVYKYVDNLDEPTWKEMKTQMLDRYHLLYYQEGLSTVVTVARNRVTGNIWLANNGKIDASTTADMPTQVLVAHLPFLFLGDRARDTTLIGLASGITLGAMNLHPELQRIDVVEIEPSMPEAAAFFRNWNHDALGDPRVRIHANDGRNHVLLMPEHSQDLVVSEPSNPWLTGVANLFTREFFELGRSRLRAGGVWSQWVQMYGMDSRDLRSVIRTFCEVFPYVRIFATIEDADLVMVGSNDPLVLDGVKARELLHKNVGVEAELAAVGMQVPDDLLAVSLMDRDQGLLLGAASEQKPVRAEAPLNTDDNLLVEYSAPKNLHRHTSADNVAMLRHFAQVPSGVYPTADGWISLANTYFRRDDVIRAMLALKEGMKLEPQREDLQDLFAAYQLELKKQLGMVGG